MNLILENGQMQCCTLHSFFLTNTLGHYGQKVQFT